MRLSEIYYLYGDGVWYYSNQSIGGTPRLRRILHARKDTDDKVIGVIFNTTECTTCTHDEFFNYRINDYKILIDTKHPAPNIHQSPRE